jgi:hypothetical protein
MTAFTADDHSGTVPVILFVGSLRAAGYSCSRSRSVHIAPDAALVAITDVAAEPVGVRLAGRIGLPEEGKKRDRLIQEDQHSLSALNVQPRVG